MSNVGQAPPESRVEASRERLDLMDSLALPDQQEPQAQPVRGEHLAWPDHWDNPAHLDRGESKDLRDSLDQMDNQV